eukprot:3631163-Alexandrium_andersonii.AAC.1
MGGGGGKANGVAASSPSGRVLNTVSLASAPAPSTLNRGRPLRQFKWRQAAAVKWSHGMAVSIATEAVIAAKDA